MTDQVELRLGHPAPSLTSDDYAATILIATAFAGHFRSRINMLVREQEGLTYGAYGGVTAGKDHGTFILSTSTTPENLPRMLSLLYAEWDRLVQEPLREDELHQARQSLYNNFWRSIETPDGTAAIALDLAINDLPADYYTRLLAEIDQLDPAALLAVQQRVFDPSRMLTAAVGELDVIARALAPYGSPHHIVLEEEQQ
jgi:predicted Zn-dependent peptidase